MTNTIDSSLLLSNYQGKERKTGSSNLGKDDFLKLLMTQLQNQDPSSPIDDTQFIAQMAQFTSLEQLTNLNSTFNDFIASQKQSQLISYNQLIGKEISWQKLIYADEENIEIEEGKGKVTSIELYGDGIMFTLEDGTKLDPSNISKINGITSETSMLQASMMIGKIITYKNEENESVSSIVKSVSFKGGQTTYQLDNQSITASQIIKIES